MADISVTVTRLTPNPDFRWGNKRVKFRKLVFVDNYRTAGFAIPAASFGLKRIDHINVTGDWALASAHTTANGVRFVLNAARTVATAIFIESAATGLAVLEKTDNEAVPTGAYVNVMVVGV